MKQIPLIAAMAALILGSANGAIWQTANGTVEAQLTGVHGPFVALTSDKVTSLVLVNDLPDADLLRVAEFMAKQPVKRVAWNQSKSRLATELLSHLEVMRDGKLVAFDPGTRPEPEFYVIYFGASWCPPCREFSHRFVSMYQRLRELAPDRFEAIFISSDNTVREQEQYVRSVPMAWPVLDFRYGSRVRSVNVWQADSIPGVVVLTPDGNALYHSHHGSEYVGPDKPIEQLERLLSASQPGDVRAKVALHRLAVLQRLRAGANQPLEPAPYVIALDMRQYQTLEANELQATLDVDEKGHVTDASFDPKPPAVIEYKLSQDASRWLFLPAVREGKAVATKIRLPVRLRE